MSILRCLSPSPARKQGGRTDSLRLALIIGLTILAFSNVVAYLSICERDRQIERLQQDYARTWIQLQNERGWR